MIEECGWSTAVGKGKEQSVPSSLPGGKQPADTLTLVLTDPFLDFPSPELYDTNFMPF